MCPPHTLTRVDLYKYNMQVPKEILLGPVGFLKVILFLLS